MKCYFIKVVYTAAIYLLFAFNAFAQDAYYQNNASSERGYWRLFTDYADRNTIIKFYNARQQVIYEEIIRGKYIKLNNKNVRLLDRTLNRLMDNQLIASTVKSTDLLEANRQDLADVPAELLRDDLKASRATSLANTSDFRINTACLTGPGKLHIIFENLQRKNIKIWLQNEMGVEVYADHTSLAGYFRTLDLAGMQPGKYTLRIKGKNIDFTRKVALSYKDDQPHLRTVPIDNEPKYVSSKPL